MRRNPMPKDGLGMSRKRQFTRCPKCQELIDATVEVCRFCGSALSAEEREQGAAVHRIVTDTISKRNDRRAFVAAALGLAGSVFVYAIWFLRKYWRRSQPSRR